MSNNTTSRQPLPSLADGDGGGSLGDWVCCGQHAVCEKELLRAAETPVDYFDDEELDRFRGRSAADYSSEEEEEFREVLYTTLAREVEEWVQSLEARGIELPASVRDEALLIIGEQRFGSV